MKKATLSLIVFSLICSTFWQAIAQENQGSSQKPATTTTDIEHPKSEVDLMLMLHRKMMLRRAMPLSCHSQPIRPLPLELMPRVRCEYK